MALVILRQLQYEVIPDSFFLGEVIRLSTLHEYFVFRCYCQRYFYGMDTLYAQSATLPYRLERIVSCHSA